ncbi:uncharacterized protein LOC127865490 [Dreissena polymorpha]|uniref:uncharacterized protein LOC127865490 n=1 Tax=Dreissena polymorpha TaxID=45954 RepID=UPI002264F392|nr:uncharacterized protein LOC127865490 [Dreissena polymorpha]
MRPTPCQNSSMCKDKECCVSDYGEVGDNMSSGKCQPMGIAKDKCLLSNPSGRPEGIVPYACPCKENHVCAEVDVIPARFGSIGKCVSTADMLTVDTHDIDESD